MSKKMTFFIYLIERYAESKSKTASQVLSEWDSLNLTDFIYDMYEIYHIERVENAFDDIDELVSEKKVNTWEQSELEKLKNIKKAP